MKGSKKRNPLVPAQWIQRSVEFYSLLNSISSVIAKTFLKPLIPSESFMSKAFCKLLPYILSCVWPQIPFTVASSNIRLLSENFKDFQFIAFLESAIGPGETISEIRNPSIPKARIKNENVKSCRNVKVLGWRLPFIGITLFIFYSILVEEVNSCCAWLNVGLNLELQLSELSFWLKVVHWIMSLLYQH